MDVVWVDLAVVEAIHDAQSAEHGGLAGVRDAGLLPSALAKPLNRMSYGDPDMIDRAAAYARGIARDQTFLDGNKRTAFVVMVLFLELNGIAFEANDAESVVVMLGVADGSVDEPVLAAWFRLQLHG